MTALIGRIPRNGVVEDPFPFKVIVGKDNLAANGIEIPGLDGMIFSGKSSGDWTLSCVRGKVHSVTYVFDDGTIRTLSADIQNTDQRLKFPQNSDASGRSLGWISDRRGIPCVTGTRITNAATYLGGRILAAGAEAAAGAFAQAETTNTVSAVQGVSTSVITGDAGKYAMGKALSGSAREISAYLRERAAQSFDVIYVDTGSELAIHIDVELPIDYEHNGRKTTYAYYDDENTRDIDDLD
jgi:integrating conjugative element protein (TIGR03752 family)